MAAIASLRANDPPEAGELLRVRRHDERPPVELVAFVIGLVALGVSMLWIRR